MAVNVNDGYALSLAHKVLGSYGYVVEQAEAAGHAGMGVVAGRPHQRKIAAPRCFDCQAYGMHGRPVGARA